MRIGSAYERLVSGDTGGGGYRQQNPYSRQYQQQQNFYRQQQQYQQQYQHQVCVMYCNAGPIIRGVKMTTHPHLCFVFTTHAHANQQGG